MTNIPRFALENDRDPTKSLRMPVLIRSRWVAVAVLVPLPILMFVHRYLGLSDALMVQTPPGEREAHVYNGIMVLVGYGGAAAFLLHSLVFGERSLRRLMETFAILGL